MAGASVQTVDGVFYVDLEDATVVGPSRDASFDPPPEPASRPPLPRLVATSGSGSTVAVVVDAKPPLLVSHDAGRTWKDSGRGLPPGHAVAVAPEDPDRVLFAARNRLYLSTDGGRFWQSLDAELPDIENVSFAD